MKITEKEFNVITGETTFTERDETAQEQTAREAREVEFAQQQAEATAKAAQRQAILDRLGLTEEEARILLGGN
jgi:hypothetical protein